MFIRLPLLVLLVLFFPCCNRHAPLSENKLPFDSLFEARSHGKWGWIDRSGKAVIPFVFDSILRYENNECCVKYDGKTGLIDCAAHFIIRPEYEEILPMEGDTLFGAKRDGKCGLIRRDETVLIPFMYEFVYSTHSDGDSIYEAEVNGKYGLVSKYNRPIAPFIFDGFSSWWQCGRLCYTMGFSWGTITAGGKYEKADFRSEEEAYTAFECTDDTTRYDAACGRVCVYIKALNKFGYMDEHAHWTIEPKYASAQTFSEGLAVVSEDNKRYYFIDTTGKKVLGDFCNALNFTHGVAVVNTDSLIDKSGKVIAVSPCPVWGFDEQYNMFKLDARNDDFAEGDWGLMNLQGKLIVDPRLYHEFNIPSDGMIAVCEKIEDEEMITSSHGHRWGFIDTTGKTIVPFRYEDEPFFDSDFHDGLAPVPMEGGYGYIDKKGEMAIPGKFSSAQNFNHGLARVYIGKKMTYIDPKGKIVWQEE